MGMNEYSLPVISFRQAALPGPLRYLAPRSGKLNHPSGRRQPPMP